MYSGSSIRKSLIAVALLICASLTWTDKDSYAQAKYPSRNIDLIIAFAPGGTTDVAGRIIAEELSKLLNVNLAPINKPGATGTIAGAFTLNARKDGYTLMLNSGSGMVLSHFVLPDVPFDTLRDFIPIRYVIVSPTIIAVKGDSPLKSFEDLINYTRKNPAKLTYGSAGAGSDTHLVMEQLQEAANVKFSHVPLKGGGQVVPSVLGGHVDLGSTLVSTAAPHLRADTLRGLVLAHEKRLTVFPNVPTYGEKAYPQVFIKYWGALFAAAGTPKAVLDVLESASEKVLRSENYKERIEKLGGSVDYSAPAEMRKAIQEEQKATASLVGRLGLKSGK